MEKYKISVFTPVYNREKTLPRLFECIKNQTYKNFEYIIVNDGSSDNSQRLIDEFVKNSPDIEIKAISQKNKGKHIATNEAVKAASGDFFITIDSDDAFKPEALSVFIEEWEKIPQSDREKYKGISCRTCDLEGNRIGNAFPKKYLDCNDLDLRFKYNIEGELWGMTRTEVIREFPYPEISGLHFYPENIHWNNVGRKYITRFVDIPLRYYINDTDNSLTDKNNVPSKELFFMREHFINDCWDYFKYNPKHFIKNIIGLNRDGLASGKNFGEIIKVPNTAGKKILTTLAFPIGFILNKK
ncbi:MAG: glycosyltransferase family 2 protein [Ruminococcus sp.]|nr:glycosyltransferase family 2 protein [Ruminococcus sp.]